MEFVISKIKIRKDWLKVLHLYWPRKHLSVFQRLWSRKLRHCKIFPPFWNIWLLFSSVIFYWLLVIYFSSPKQTLQLFYTWYKFILLLFYYPAFHFIEYSLICFFEFVTITEHLIICEFKTQNKAQNLKCTSQATFTGCGFRPTQWFQYYIYTIMVSMLVLIDTM